MANLQSLIAQVAKLPTETSRKVASLVGAIVGDAACLHLEWVYDQDKIPKIVPEGESPAFWPESHCPFFSLPNGQVSCYADEAIQVLKVMDANDGKFDQSKVIEHYLKYFGDASSPYQVAKDKRKDKKYPIEGPWIQGALISMMDRWDAGIKPPGSDDAREHDGLTTALPLIIQKSPSIDFKDLKPAYTIMTQDPDAIEHHNAEAYLIAQFIKGSKNPLENTKEKFFENKKIYKEIEAVEKGKADGKSAKDLVKEFGMACPMPGSFQSSLVSIIGAKSYQEAICETILCAGDSCSRANLIGACLGAKFGIQGIPGAWMSKVDGIEGIIEKSIKCFT